MALKYNLTAAEHEALDDASKALYRNIGEGKFRLDLVDDPRKEYRDLNASLTKQLQDETEKRTRAEAGLATATEAAKKFEGLSDADLQLFREGKKKTGKDDANLADIIAEAMKPITTELASVKETMATQRASAEAATRKLKDAKRDAAITDAALKAGLAPSYTDFVLPRVAGLYDFDLESDTLTVLGKNDEGDPLTPQRYFDKLRVDNPAFFGSQKGGDVPPRETGSGGATKRPDGKIVLTNPTSRELGEHAAEIAKGAKSNVIVEYTDGRTV